MTVRISGAVLAVIALTAIGCSAPHEARSTTLYSAPIAAPPKTASPAPPVAAASAKTVTDESAAEATPEPEPLPTACGAEGASVKDAKVCLPPKVFAKKLCGGLYPEVALGMFMKGTPWARVWLAGDVDAWNASGGLTHHAKLAFDEEVIVLSRHAAPSMGGIVMTGSAASFDVLRWDGTCVSIMEGELTTRRPPAPKPAPVPWSRLEETTRRALLVSPKVKSTHESLDKACNAVSSATEKKSCDKADKAFTQAVADFIRGGSATLPTPARRP